MCIRDSGWVVTNDEVHKLCQMYPDKFYGFASVDPHRADALEVLEKAFHEQGPVSYTHLLKRLAFFYPKGTMHDKKQKYTHITKI